MVTALLKVDVTAAVGAESTVMAAAGATTATELAKTKVAAAAMTAPLPMPRKPCLIKTATTKPLFSRKSFKPDLGS